MTIQAIFGANAFQVAKTSPKIPATKSIPASLFSGNMGILGATAEGNKGFIGKIFGGIKKGLDTALTWAKTHRKISIPIAIVLGILGISKITGKSKAKKSRRVRCSSIILSKQNNKKAPFLGLLIL